MVLSIFFKFANLSKPSAQAMSRVDLAHKEHAKIMDDFNLDQLPAGTKGT